MQLSIKVTAVAALVASVLVAQIASADITTGAGSGTTPNANVDVPLPAIVANDVTVAGPSSAQVGATVDPNGLPTTVHFEYGANNVLNMRTPSVSIGAGVDPTKVAADRPDLQPGTSYSYRVGGETAAGTTTRPCQRLPAPTAGGRAEARE